MILDQSNKSAAESGLTKKYTRFRKLSKFCITESIFALQNKFLSVFEPLYRLYFQNQQREVFCYAMKLYLEAILFQ
jgi:hypothetical protein